MTRVTVLILVSMLGVGGALAVGMVLLTKATARLLVSVTCMVASGGLLVWQAFSEPSVGAMATGVLLTMACALASGASLVRYGEAIDERTRLQAKARRSAAEAKHQLEATR